MDYYTRKNKAQMMINALVKSAQFSKSDIAFTIMKETAFPEKFAEKFIDKCIERGIYFENKGIIMETKS